MKIFRPVMALAMIIFLAGCYPSKEEASRYPSVAIPQYKNTDYYALLSNKNPEVVYNAVCNLAEYAIDIGEMLSKKDADKSKAEYTESKNIYTKVLDLTGSKDPRIQAASLRFLQLFSTNYGPKGELIVPALRVTPRSAQAAYEKIELLTRVALKEGNFDTAILKAFLGDRSWLVSRAAYALVDKLENEKMRSEIIERYKKADTTFERLLMLGALKSNFSESVFVFLSGELLASPDKYIRRMLIDMLPGGKDERAVISWMEENYRKLRDEDMKYLAGSNLFNMEKGFSNRLFAALLRQGYVPEEYFWERLYSYLNDYGGRKERTVEVEEIFQNLKNLENAASLNSAVSKSWAEYKSRRDAESYVDPTLQKEFSQAAGRFRAGRDSAVAVFKKEAESIFARYNLDDKKKAVFLESQDDDLKDYFPEELKKK